MSSNNQNNYAGQFQFAAASNGGAPPESSQRRRKGGPPGAGPAAGGGQDRNPLEQLRRLGKHAALKTGNSAAEESKAGSSGNFQKDLAEVKQIVDSVARPSQQKCSIAHLMTEVLDWIDSRNIGQAEAGILDYILKQPSLRDAFRHVARS